MIEKAHHLELELLDWKEEAHYWGVEALMSYFGNRLTIG
jgi:hypothetical protein